MLLLLFLLFYCNNSINLKRIKILTRLNINALLVVQYMEGKMFSTSIRLPKEMNERLTRLSEKTGRTKSFYIHEAIYRFLEELERVYLTEQEKIEIRKKENQEDMH